MGLPQNRLWVLMVFVFAVACSDEPDTKQRFYDVKQKENDPPVNNVPKDQDSNPISETTSQTSSNTETKNKNVGSNEQDKKPPPQTPPVKETPKTKPVKEEDDNNIYVFILAGQSNMEGYGRIDGDTGSLKSMVANGDDQDNLLKERDDVHIIIDGSRQASGPLKPGYGVKDRHIGPELGFGHEVGNAMDAPIVLVKVAWGGKSLAKDFRPPSAGGLNGTPRGSKGVGEFYSQLQQKFRSHLKEIPTTFPQFKDRKMKLAGFVWHQGWNDRVNEDYNKAYQDNMVFFINDIRLALGTPDLPFVIATTSMGDYDQTDSKAISIVKAQLDVPEDPRLQSEYVVSVDTAPAWRDASMSPIDQGYHWNQNGESYFLIGKSMGQAMTSLLQQK